MPELTEAEQEKVEELKGKTADYAKRKALVRTVPRYQNFVPGDGHTRMPSYGAVQAALEKGEEAPEPAVTRGEHRRDNETVTRKNGYQNFTPGPQHKLMKPYRETVNDPDDSPALVAETFACSNCQKDFHSMAALRRHGASHRKGE
jgi:hypothetical protein